MSKIYDGDEKIPTPSILGRITVKDEKVWVEVKKIEECRDAR